MLNVAKEIDHSQDLQRSCRVKGLKGRKAKREKSFDAKLQKSQSAMSKLKSTVQPLSQSIVRSPTDGYALSCRSSLGLGYGVLAKLAMMIEYHANLGCWWAQLVLYILPSSQSFQVNRSN
jgi:hypothetical protein